MLLDQHRQPMSFPFPNHCDDISNAPFEKNADNHDICPPHNDMNSTAVLFRKDLRKRTRQNDSQTPPKKYRKLQPPSTFPAKTVTSLPISLNVCTPNRQLQHLNWFQNIVTRVSRESPTQTLSQLRSFVGSPNLTAQFSVIRPALEMIVSELNLLSIPYADAFPNIAQDTSAYDRCHPLLLQILKPVQTTGDGNCMYNALSLNTNRY